LGRERAQRELEIRVNVDRDPSRAELVDLVERTELSILTLELGERVRMEPYFGTATASASCVTPWSHR
jgi:hypothetical protein